MTTISIDFETRSTVDLKKVGVYAYAEHPSTDVWCMAWAINDMEPELWKMGEDFPELMCGLREPLMRAWNAQFERVIWNTILVPRYGFPELPLEAWHCTMAEAQAMALPRSLDHCAKVLGIEEQKEEGGQSLALRMSKPRSTKGGKVIWWDVPARLERLHRYCEQDVRTERAASRAVRRLDPREREIYLLDQKINDRGMLVDVPLARAAKRIIATGLERANEEIRDATGGAVTGVTKVVDMTGWLRDTEGLDVDSVRKSVVRELLEGELPSPARVVLEARAEAGRASVAKVKMILGTRCADDRIRGMILYHGASTGRWSGMGVQPHNFPRGEVDAEMFIPEVLAGEYDAIDRMYPPLMVISSLLRGLFRAAKGSRFLVGDFAQIEARALAWLAGQKDLVKLFREGGKVYETMAARIYGVSVDSIENPSEQRQRGKNAELGCGYQMGWKTFIKQVWEAEGIKLSEKFAKRVITAYRNSHERIVCLWDALDTACFAAVVYEGKVHTVYGCKFVVRGKYLWLVLPSGRPLCYMQPKIKPRETPWGETRDAVVVWGVNGVTRKWEQFALYGGLLTNNIVQALARDLMAGAMLRLEEARYPVVLTVHDEIVTEVPNGRGSLNEVLTIMKQRPPWAESCPVEVEGWEGERYRK